MSYQHVQSSQPDPFAVDEDDDMILQEDDAADFVINDDQEPTPAAANATSFASNAFHIPEQPQTQQIGNERLEQRRFMGGDTLDEPVYTTLLRDVKAVGTRLKQVVWPSSHDVDGLTTSEIQQWDLWGPLVFCLVIATALSMLAPNHQSSVVFSGMFAVMWIGQVVVTLNIKLLGGTVSFFHALCVTGYSLFPLMAASILSAFVSHRLIRLPIDTIMVVWAIYSTTKNLKNSGVLPSRMFLATFPVGLLFAGIGWVCVVT